MEMRHSAGLIDLFLFVLKHLSVSESPGQFFGLNVPTLSRVRFMMPILGFKK